MVRSPLEATGLHDSSLDSVQVSILDKSCLIRTVGVCGDLAEGALADIGCHNLESFFLLSDSQELSDNAWPGNIQDGHFDGLGCTGVLRLYLAGGMLEAGGAVYSGRSSLRCLDILHDPACPRPLEHDSMELLPGG